MPALIDVGLAAVVAAATIVAISVASEPSSRPPDAYAYALGVVIGVVLLARRRWPLAVLIASSAILFSHGGNVFGMTIRVLLAEDQALVRAGFRGLLDRSDDIEVVGEVANGAVAAALSMLNGSNQLDAGPVASAGSAG